MPISAELLRVLKPTGAFVLNIKEKVVNGERHTYVIELILEMRKQGWLWTEEFIKIVNLFTRELYHLKKKGKRPEGFLERPG